MKALKYALLGVGALALVALGVAAYLVITFDPRVYEPQIAALVKEKTGRTLHIAGEFNLGFSPDLTVKLGGVSLTERNTDERFAAAEIVRMTVKLRPLLSKTLVADELFIAGARARVIRYADGRLNIDDLIRSDGPTPQFDIGRLEIRHSAVSYRDMGSGKAYDLTRVDLSTGRLTSPVVTPLKLSLSASDSENRFDIMATLQGRLGIDLARGQYALEQAALDLEGRAGETTGVSAQVKGAFAARAQSGEIDASSINATMIGDLRGIPFQTNMQAQKASVRAGSVSAQEVSAAATATGATGKTALTLAAPRLVWAEHDIAAESVKVELDATHGGRAIRASLTSPIEVQTAAHTVTLSKLATRISLSGPDLPQQGLSGVLEGAAQLDLATQTVRTSLAGTIGGSRVKATVGVAGFTMPVYRFAIDVDQLDLDRYAVRPAPTAGSGTFDLSRVAALPATGTLHIGALTSGGLKARNVKLAVKP